MVRMSDPPAGLDVVCPSCGGRSVVEPANRSHSHWGCPFCAASNPLPPAPASFDAVSRRNRRWPRAIAAVAVAGLIAAAVVAQISLPAGQYRTVEGLTAALADRGLPCRTPAPLPPPEGAREAARCEIGDSTASIITFASTARRDRYMATGVAATAVAGATWLILLDDRALAQRVSRSIGGRVVRPGAVTSGRPTEYSRRPATLYS